MKKKKRKTADDIRTTLAELLKLTATNSMSARIPGKPLTRSSAKKTANSFEHPVVNLSGSPVLRGRKRRKSSDNASEKEEDEPAPKRMAEDKILDAIKVVNNNVTAMETRMKSVRVWRASAHTRSYMYMHADPS